MKNTCPLYIVFQVSKVLFIPYCFTLAFMYKSADIIFHNFLELNSTSEKKLFFKTHKDACSENGFMTRSLLILSVKYESITLVANWVKTE